MHRSLTRRLVMGLVPMIGFTAPLLLAGCGEENTTATPSGAASKDFNEIHKDTLEQFKKNQGKAAAK
jgi:hypothetical protein